MMIESNTNTIVLKTPIHLILLPSILSGIIVFGVLSLWFDPNWGRLFGIIISILVFIRLYAKTIISAHTITKYYPFFPLIKVKSILRENLIKIDYKIIAGGNGGVLSIFSRSNVIRFECNLEERDMVGSILEIEIPWFVHE
jgi:hypothetical protein